MVQALRRRSFAAAAAALLALSGCASPDTTFFTLSGVPGTPIAALPPGTPRTVELRTPGIPGYLDRTDIVLRNADYRLQVGHFQSWAEPLADMTGRVLAEDLSQRLPAMSVFTEAGAISVTPDARAGVDIQQFSAGPDGVVRLVAQLAIEGGIGHDVVAQRRVSLTVTPGGPTTPALVAAMSAALGQLSDELVKLLLSQTDSPPTPVARLGPSS